MCLGRWICFFLEDIKQRQCSNHGWFQKFHLNQPHKKSPSNEELFASNAFWNAVWTKRVLEYCFMGLVESLKGWSKNSRFRSFLKVPKELQWLVKSKITV